LSGALAILWSRRLRGPVTEGCYVLSQHSDFLLLLVEIVFLSTDEAFS